MKWGLSNAFVTRYYRAEWGWLGSRGSSGAPISGLDKSRWGEPTSRKNTSINKSNYFLQYYI